MSLFCLLVRFVLTAFSSPKFSHISLDRIRMMYHKPDELYKVNKYKKRDAKLDHRDECRENFWGVGGNVPDGFSTFHREKFGVMFFTKNATVLRPDGSRVKRKDVRPLPSPHEMVVVTPPGIHAELHKNNNRGIPASFAPVDGHRIENALITTSLGILLDLDKSHLSLNVRLPDASLDFGSSRYDEEGEVHQASLLRYDGLLAAIESGTFGEELFSLR